MVSVRSILVVAALAAYSHTTQAAAQLPEGYLLVQTLTTYHEGRHGAIHTRAEAEEVFGQLEGRVSGIEYQSLAFGERDMAIHRAIAATAQRHGIDLWMSTWRLARRMGTIGKILPSRQAYSMKADGTIVPAFVNGKPLFDQLNSEAVSWFLKRYRSRYLVPMKGLVRGLFMNEDAIPYLASWKNDRRFEYWNNASYSPAVLEAWRRYCRKHGVMVDGKQVDRFPVHRPEMVKRGKGMTAYYPGYTVPERIYPGQRFMDLPRVEGVWKNWYDFLSEQYMNTWITPLAKAAHAVNKDEPQWFGVLYFGLHQWLLAYEDIKDPDFKVSAKHRFGAWGLQRGIDLKRLAANPYVGILVCETYPPLETSNLVDFVKAFRRIVARTGKKWGVMLHRDDRWSLNEGEEKLRWSLIDQMKPDVIVRFKLKNMIDGGPYYEPVMERYFNERLRAYRQARIGERENALFPVQERGETGSRNAYPVRRDGGNERRAPVK